MNNIIEAHLRKYSRIYKHHNNDWVEIFCPFCDDAHRKHNPTHGHLYFNMDSAYFKCFRCDEPGRLSKLLLATGFNDPEVLKRLAARTREDISYSYSVRSWKQSTAEHIHLKHRRVLDVYSKQLSSQEFNDWISYMVSRCLDIDFSKYFIFPEKINGILASAFYNYDNQFVTARFIGSSKLRYHNAKDKVPYYFQDLLSIIQHRDIVICEGIFDLINLHNYCNRFEEPFYLAMNGRSYVETIRRLITTYLLLGEYTIHIVFDIGLIRVHNTINKIQNQVSIWNNRINVLFYEPSSSKDVSDLMLLARR